ncbi:MAG: amidase [Gammaproteobacteria bacterium]|nr:amidase [Gammaproteobacteria bacterium]
MRRRQFLSLGVGALGTAFAHPCGSAEATASPAAAEQARSLDISAQTLWEAQKLHAVEFPHGELERLSDLLPAQIEDLLAVRRVPKALHLQPALRFDPRLPGRHFPPQENSVRLAQQDLEPAPTLQTDVAFASVAEQGHWLRTRQISSMALTEAYLARIHQFNPLLKAYITVTSDIAREQAENCDRELANGTYRGALHGIPYSLKDVIDTSGVPTTYGSEQYRSRVPDADATVAKKLKEAGAVLLGKAATAELANGATWFGGEVRNPWNPAEPSGGSSAGSGAAVAAGLCSFSIGTDSLGSILHPADRCGVVGLRPTFGRVPIAGCMPLTPSLERIGPLSRRVEDAALILQVINGPDPTSINSIDFGFAYDADADFPGIKVGYSPRWFERVGFGTSSSSLRDLDELGDTVQAGEEYTRVLTALRTLGVQLVEVELPKLPYAALVRNLYVEAASVWEELTLEGRDAELIAPWADVWRQARLFSAVDYFQTERFRRQVMEEMDSIFSRVDLLVAPTYGNFDLLIATNFTGHPGLTFRSGFRMSPTRGLGASPFAGESRNFTVTANISFHGRLFEEGKIIAVARAVEEKLDVWHVTPSVV